ncbi:tyrosine--tRNA ligase [candidate division WOR-3 bacterium]|uniref:Tyrosine--tRNA ligase n=1 Tax=candidate division WOR-3 bacterium TaxID=2052148 RepID=A0A660SDY7_UNCW3|nr:MAG: tyrosine--tRNA ligase [candidate division WOR-3 bacterium]
MSPEEQLEHLKTGVAEIISEDELLAKLRKKRPLRIKLGIDPSSPDVHLGFSVVLRKLRQFQDLGHTAVLIIGDFTGLIGDPSGLNQMRPMLTKKEIKKNVATYRKQIFKILDPKRTDLLYNSGWLGKLTAYDLIDLGSRYTLARVIERDDFSNRIKKGVPVYMHEILYPLFQAYDSIVIKADVELGGTDQKFNLLVGRDLMREFKLEPQVVMMVPLLEGTDGKRKMSKSLGNVIGITDPPEEMFGKIMSIPDHLIYRYFELCTDLFPHRLQEIKELLADPRTNPRDVKFELAKTIVRMYHSAKKAVEAAEEFERVFAKKKLPKEIPIYKAKMEKVLIVDLLVDSGLLPSRSEAKRKLREGAVRVNGRKVGINYRLDVSRSPVVQVGKRKFVRIVRG